jgi:hypothetical protein
MSTNTTRMGASSFVSSDLQAAIQSLEPTLVSYKSTVDALCADIVSVEKFLQERLILVEVNMGTGICPKLDGEDYIGQFYSLRWHEDKPGKFRLMYSRDDEYGHDGEPCTYEIHPLAEAPLYLRVSLVAQLPSFLEVVGTALKKWQSHYRYEKLMATDNVTPEKIKAVFNA